jgi:predicted ATPase
MESPGVVGAAPAAFAAVAGVDDQHAGRAATDAGLTPGRGLLDVLLAACDESPVLLVLDDAQWCDASTLGAIAASARDLARQPFAVLLGVRLQPPSASLDEIRAHVGRDLPGVCVRLGPLDADAVGSLAESLLPGLAADDRERLVRRVQADSAGSPLLAVEMLRAVAHGMDLGRATRSWPEAGRTLDDTIPADLPDAIVSAIRVNYRRLSADAQAALATAAVLGDRVNEESVALGSGLPAERVAEALDELEWQRWLVADGRGYAFSARLVRDVVARDFLTPGQRERIARRASIQGLPSA